MNIEIGKKISVLRKERNMTQEKLASEMGVSIAAVSKWETGNSIPDIITLCNLADFFMISTDELLGRNKLKKKAVIADDVEFVRDVLKKILIENHYEIVGEAGDGIKLMRILSKTPVDLVMLDITMPNMDGLTALQNIVKNYPNTNVIMCSEIENESTIDKAIQLGASAFVTKPFLPETIVSNINKLAH